MSLENLEYKGPFLPMEMDYMAVTMDNTSSKRVDEVAGILANLMDEKCTVIKNVKLAAFSQHPLYTVDIMIYPSKSATPVAVLVIPSEQYDSSGEFMLGRQAMRVRHMQTMGYKVLCVNTCKIEKMNKPDELTEYLLNLFREELETN